MRMVFSGAPTLVAPADRPFCGLAFRDPGAAASSQSASAECPADPFDDPPLAWPADAGIDVGRYTMNVLPLPTSLCSLISPPRRVVSSRQIDRPRPVPPYLRLVVPSA